MARGLMVGKKKKSKPKYMTISKRYHTKTQTYWEYIQSKKKKKKKNNKDND